MKITEVHCFRLDMDLTEPYTIAYETISKASNIVFKLVTDTGLVGWGCAAPDQTVTGESAEDVLTAVKGVIEPLLQGENPFQIARVMEELAGRPTVRSSALAMVDMALHDLLAKKAGLPLYQLLGGYRKRIATSITIGILPLEETLSQAADFLKQGFFILKLKGGISLDEDVEKVIALRQRFGNDFLLRFDANQGYSSSQAVHFLEQIKSANLEIFEQPTCKTKDDSLGQVTRTVSVPVMADESIQTLKDAFRLAANDRIDMVNIKLMKMGGIFRSLHINSVAKAAGMEVMVGCLDECGLAISAGLHFALSRANIEFADLDGHLDLVGDPFSGIFSLKDGYLYPTEASGLGKISL